MKLTLVVTKYFRPSILNRFFKRKPVQVHHLMEKANKEEWYYFRRTNPVQFEIYPADSDFEIVENNTSLLDSINHPGLFSQPIQHKSNDLLCLCTDSGWTELVFWEGRWIPAPENENIGWDHHLLAKGTITFNPST